MRHCSAPPIPFSLLLETHGVYVIKKNQEDTKTHTFCHYAGRLH